MKKFVFTLHALLHVRRLLEKQERHHMLQLTREIHELEDERSRMSDSRDGAARALSGRMGKGVTVTEAQQVAGYLVRMTEELKVQDERIRSANVELEQCRARLVEVLKDINMLEKVREKQYQQYLADVQKEEDKLIGDFVSFQTTNQRPAL